MLKETGFARVLSHPPAPAGEPASTGYINIPAARESMKSPEGATIIVTFRNNSIFFRFDPQLIFSGRYNHGGGGVAGDVYRGSEHIQQTVNG